MSKTIIAKVNVSKINKARLFKGKHGMMLDLVLIETPADRYGNDFMVVEGVTKEEREAGKKGTILGNAKYAGGGKGPRPQPAKPAVEQGPDDDSVPF